MNFDYNKVIPIKGDASFRKFYRKKIKKKSSIIVYAEKEKIKNLLNYDSINQLLLKKNVSAPRLLSENFNQNFIEIEDFGKKTLFDILKIKRSNKFKIYKRILVTLIKLQNRMAAYTCMESKRAKAELQRMNSDLEEAKRISTEPTNLNVINYF